MLKENNLPLPDNYKQDHLSYGDQSSDHYITVVSKSAGFLSYHLDGLEHHKGLFDLDVDSYQETIAEKTVIKEGEIVQYGQPLLKIVDNWYWFYSVLVPTHPGLTLESLDKVVIEFDFAPGEEVNAYLKESEIDTEKQQVRLSYRIERQLPGFDAVRWTGSVLRFNRHYGTIVPAEALFNNNGTKGVFLNQGGRVIFCPVEIIHRSGEKIMVEGISANSMVITRPELVEEGMRLN